MVICCAWLEMGRRKVTASRHGDMLMKQFAGRVMAGAAFLFAGVCATVFMLVAACTLIVPMQMSRWQLDNPSTWGAGRQIMVDLSDMGKSRGVILFPMLLVFAGAGYRVARRKLEG